MSTTDNRAEGTRRMPIVRWRGFPVLLAIFLFGNVALAQTVVVQLMNGRSGKPAAKVKVFVSLDEDQGYPYSTFFTNRQGEVRFESNGAKTLQAGSVGQVGCGERTVGAPQPSYSIAEILKTGLRTKNTCGSYDPQPVPGLLIYIVRPVTWWELFRN